VTAKGDAYRIFCQPPDGRLAELACTGAPWARLQDHLGGDWGVSRYSRRPRVRIAISERDFRKFKNTASKNNWSLWYTTRSFGVWEKQRAAKIPARGTERASPIISQNLIDFNADDTRKKHNDDNKANVKIVGRPRFPAGRRLSVGEDCQQRLFAG